jgi:predicted nucleic acid-binding protein
MDEIMTQAFMNEREHVFVDTSANFALVNKKDIDHMVATNFLKEATEKRCGLISTNFILAETYTLIMRKIGREIAIRYIKDFRNSAFVIRVLQTDEEEAWDIILKHKDKNYTYTDATSFAVMERLGIKKAFAFDKHFDQYGFQRLP